MTPDSLVLPIALGHGADTHRVGIRRQRAWPRSKDSPAACHVVELNHALSNDERVVVRQRHNSCAELDSVRAFSSGGKKHLRRGNHFPASRVVLAAPELLVA